MPLTPLHLGPALLLGFLFYKKMDISAVALGSVILDIEGLVRVFAGSDIIHGYSHYYIVAFLVGTALSFILLILRDKAAKLKEWMQLGQETSFRSIFAGSIAGTLSHVFLDSFLYWDIRPFHPLTDNPFYDPSYSTYLYIAITFFCVICFIPAYFLYVTRYRVVKDIGP